MCALLTAQPLYKQYQSDAVNNTQEAPGAATVLPADGSINTKTPGNTPGIKTMKVTDGQPGGSIIGTRILDDPTIQQATSTNANTTGASAGFQSDSTVGVISGNNSLQNNVSAMALGAAAVPAIATGVGRAAGLTQSPENQ